MNIAHIFRRKKEYRKHIVIGGIILVFIIVAAARSFGKEAATNREPVVPTVSLIDLSEYKEDRAVVLGSGEVESLEQVELRSEVSARVTSVRVKLGQTVRPGQVIAYFDGAQLSAQLRQAQADLQSALASKDSAQAGADVQQAVLEDLQNGARPEEIAISQASLKNAEDALKDSFVDTKNILEGIVNSVENSIYSNIDPLFTNPRTNDPQLTFTTFDQPGRIFVQGKRAQMNGMLSDWTQAVDVLQPTELEVLMALDSAEQDLLFAQEFLETLLNVIVNEISLTDAQKSTHIATVTTARSGITNHLTTVQTHKQLIESQKTAITQAKEQLSLTLAGPTKEQVAAQQAAVNQAGSGLHIQDANIARAQAIIDSIRSELGKRSIRTPIGGTIATLPVRVGELVSPSALVASVVNTGGLQVTAFIDSADLSGIVSGATTTINGDISGTVTHIAPSIDPSTRKVEVIIAVNEEHTSLVVGQFVDIEIERAEDTALPIRLPLQAIHVATDGSFVFTINSEHTIEAHPVVLDRVIGESVEVISGLDTVERIIKNVRGLDIGDEVQVL